MLSGKCSVKSAIGSHWVGSGCHESLTCVCCTVHHEQPNLSLNKKAGLDVMQSHLLCRTHFGQYLISCTGIIRRWGLLHKIRLPPAAASCIIAAYELCLVSNHIVWLVIFAVFFVVVVVVVVVFRKSKVLLRANCVSIWH